MNTHAHTHTQDALGPLRMPGPSRPAPRPPGRKLSISVLCCRCRGTARESTGAWSSMAVVACSMAVFCLQHCCALLMLQRQSRREQGHTLQHCCAVSLLRRGQGGGTCCSTV
eukprot:1159979-Pelagomonas_calceolata.AAC.1